MRIVPAPEFHAWLDRVQGAARAAFAGILAKSRDRQGVHALAACLYEKLASASEELCAMLPPDRPLACCKGCSACCNAFIQSAPLYTIAAFLHARERCPPDVLARAAARARSRRRPCPFLEDRVCQIYPARPPVCRYYFSYEAAWCEIDRCCVIDDEAVTARLRHGLAARAAFAIERAAAEALAEVGLSSRPHALDCGLRILLAIPDTVERWLAGEVVFSEAAKPFRRRVFDWWPPLRGVGHGPDQGAIPAP